VIETTATTQEGFEFIDAAIPEARRGEQVSSLHHRLHDMLRLTGSEAEALLIL
jgi:hypothetical protein